MNQTTEGSTGERPAHGRPRDLHPALLRSVFVAGSVAWVAGGLPGMHRPRVQSPALLPKDK